MTEAGSVQAKDTSACCLGRTTHGMEGSLVCMARCCLPGASRRGGTGGSVCGGVERVSESVSKCECEQI